VENTLEVTQVVEVGILRKIVELLPIIITRRMDMRNIDAENCKESLDQLHVLSKR